MRGSLHQCSRWVAHLAIQEILIIIQNLKHQTHNLNQRYHLHLPLTRTSHQPYQQPKESSRLVRYHLQIIPLRRAFVIVAPVELDTLTAVEVQEFLVEDPESVWPAGEGEEFLLGEEVGVVGGVDGLCGAVYGMGDGDASALFRSVLDVVDPVHLRWLDWDLK